MTMSNWDKADVTRKILPTLAAEVARELGEGWERALDEGHSNLIKLAGPNGERLGMSVDPSKPEHVYIDGWLPNEIHASGAHTSDLKWPEIYVALSRGAAAIVKEINRRLMPAYQVALAEARNRAEGSRQDQAKRDETVRIVAELLGVPAPVPRHANPRDSVTVSRFHKGSGMTRVEIRISGHVRIEASGDIDELRDVVASLGKVPA